MAAGDRDLDPLAVLVGEDDGPAVHMAFQGGDLQHLAGPGAHRQEGGIGGPALFAQRRQHDLLDGVEPLQSDQQGRVEPARAIGVGGRHELVVEAEPVEEGAQAGVVMGRKALVGPERIADHAERLFQVLLQHLLVGQARRDLAHPVHVVGEGDQTGGDGVVGERPKGGAHHGGPRHFAEGAHMGQARGAIAGLEDHRPLQGLERGDRLVGLAGADEGGGQIALGVGQPQAQDPRQQGARLFERPALGPLGRM